ncbi:hypothetical protein P343_13165 [Sporolactobacillus laevolacticus DSM 442]|uniref:Uncharacterized protein n=1 Tax=Sporolactobacillus laevolacticus DSM 442 TaxID=1395513 RepID=V6IXD4_9BACL|nr:hypothetical protein P343_13165 [Sporolactobacillus laevolacticus DSM 442]
MTWNLYPNRDQQLAQTLDGLLTLPTSEAKETNQNSDENCLQKEHKQGEKSPNDCLSAAS